MTCCLRNAATLEHAKKFVFAQKVHSMPYENLWMFWFVLYVCWSEHTSYLSCKRSMWLDT